MPFGIAVAYAWGMSKVELEQLLGDAEALLAVSGEIQYPPTKAVGMLLNAVEALCSDKQEILKEVLKKSSG